MTQSAVLGFAAVSLAVIVIPGPSVLFAVSRAMVAGRRVALLTVLGNASGIFAQVFLIVVGLGVIVARSELAHDMLRMVGAAYLVWLGVSAIRHRHLATRAVGSDTPMATARPWRDGFAMGITNPKTVVFLAALLPQHVEPAAGMVATQMMLLGAILCAIAVVCDGTWAVVAAHARPRLVSDPRRLTWMSVAGGLVMVALGLGLLLG